MTATNVAVGILVLGLLIYRQLIARPVRGDFRVPLILAIIGVIELYSFLKNHHLDAAIAAALAGSLALAAVFGAGRALTTRVWIRNGQAWRQGNWFTGVQWVVALAAHLGYDQLVYKNSSLGNVTILLYLAVSFAVQRAILQARAQRLPLTSQPATPDRGTPR
jgi:hypothetical protein